MLHSDKRDEIGFSHVLTTADLSHGEVFHSYSKGNIKVKFEQHMRQKGRGIMDSVILYNSTCKEMNCKEIQSLQLSDQPHKDMTGRQMGYRDLLDLEIHSYALLISGMYSAMTFPGNWQKYVVRLPVKCTADDRQAIIQNILSR